LTRAATWRELPKGQLRRARKITRARSSSVLKVVLVSTSVAAPVSRERDAAAPPPRGVWPHLRAIFVLFHITAVLVLAVPNMGGQALSRRAWQNPTVQDEFKAWAARLRGLGVDIDARALEDRLWPFARRWTKAHRWAKRPFTPYAKYAGVTQTWRMFVAPHRYPARLHIDVRASDGTWRPVQIARSRTYDWRGAQLNHDRVRATLFRYGWANFRRPYTKLTRWLAARAAVDFPAATHLRVRMYGFRTASPEEVRRGQLPPGRYKNELVHALATFRRAP
jgi:hypothetical protein